MGAPVSSKSPVANTAAGKTHKKGSSQDMARLGMGMDRLGFGATTPTSSSKASSSRSTPVDDTTYARDTFGTQKAISSDMYFKRDTYDPTIVAEAQSRLSNFQGATSISSSQYFGRDEEEEAEMRGGGNGLISEPGSSLAGVEAGVRDLVGKVLANPDVQNVGESIRSGALKVRLTLLLLSS